MLHADVFAQPSTPPPARPAAQPGTQSHAQSHIQSSADPSSAVQSGAEPPQRCRYLRASGCPCPRRAMPGSPYCFPHGRDSRHRGRPLEIPLLEDPSDLRQLYTDIARAIAAGTLQLNTARLLVSTIRCATQAHGAARAHSAARPVRTAIRTRGRHNPEPTPAPGAPSGTEKVPGKVTDTAAGPAPECVENFTFGPDGEELAPPAPWIEERAEGEETPEPPAPREWSFDRFLRDSLFPGQAGRPLPASGYGPEGPASEPAPLPEPATGPATWPETGPGTGRETGPAPEPVTEAAAASEPPRDPEPSGAPAPPPELPPEPPPAAAPASPRPGVVSNLWAVARAAPRLRRTDECRRAQTSTDERCPARVETRVDTRLEAQPGRHASRRETLLPILSCAGTWLQYAGAGRIVQG